MSQNRKSCDNLCVINPDAPCTQTVFANLIGVTRPLVSQLIEKGRFQEGQTLREWLHAYCASLREVASGRAPKPEKVADPDALDLGQEKAALTRTQRLIQEIKLGVTKGEYAPIGVLADTLAGASGAVVAQFDQLEGLLAKACPDLDPATRDVVIGVIARARNQWISHTTVLMEQTIDLLTEPDDPPRDS